MRVNSKLGSIAFFAVVVAGLAHLAYYVSREVWHSQRAGPIDIRDFRGFFARYSELDGAYRTRRNSEAFYVAIPRLDGGRAMGHPAYVFDSSGQLVDWSSDTEDDPSFARLWPRGQMDPIPPAKLRKMMESSANTNGVRVPLLQ